MKRIFIALKVEPCETLLRIYSTLKSVLGSEKIKWVDPMNIHLTLAFLGDTEEERIKVAGIMLKQKCTGFGQFDFALAGTGVFKNFREPKLIWIGIEQSEKLLNLNNLIVSGLKDVGFGIEDREFKPHITLARIKFIKDHNSLKSALEGYQDTFIQKVSVSEVILFESILKPAGPIYKPIGKFRL